MSRPYHHEMMADLRAADPHGLRSNHELEREVEFERLGWAITDMVDVSDVRMILDRMLILMRDA